MKRIKKFFEGDAAGLIIGGALFLLALIFEAAELVLTSKLFYTFALVGAGYSVFIDAIKGILRRDFLDEKFLMSIAAIGAVVIGQSAEGVAVMLFFLLGELFQHGAVRRSRNSIKSLMQIRPDTARVIVSGKEQIVDAEAVEVGSVIVIRPGERVPCDSLVIEGTAELDTSSLTGESQPRGVFAGDKIESGVVVLVGTLTAKVERIAYESAAQRVLTLLEEATEKKAPEEAFITKFSRYYTPIVTVLALFMALLPPLLNLLTFKDALYRALSFLVVSCPCALVISVPMTFFGGIGGAASAGILYKGANTFSRVARVENVVFDKTGTLTLGSFELLFAEPVGITEEELITLAASAEYNSNHPIASSIKAVSKNTVIPTSTKELVGMGVIAEIEGHSVAVGNIKLMNYIQADAFQNDIGGHIYVAKDGKFVGAITLTDSIKSNAKHAVAELKELGVKKTYILSGDNEQSVIRVGTDVGIDSAFAQLSPEEKYRRLENIISDSENSTMYVGDGINDAPSLARADVGVAMGGVGSDSAIEAADAVIMSDDLKKLPLAIKIARKTIAIAKQNIIFSISVKILVLALVACSLAGMWLAVFADVGVAVLAILNAMRALKQPK